MPHPLSSEKPIALTCGDPAGVGPEIIERWLHAHPANRQHVIPIGPPVWLARLPIPGQPIGPQTYTPTPGHPDPAGQRIAWQALEIAAQGCMNGTYRATVTAPVNKTQLARIGYPHPGQTEFFATRWGGHPVMAFAGGRLKVVLATWHIPLSHVPTALTPERITRTVEAAATLARALHPRLPHPPRIGVCGLNPHAGENGTLGTEERDHINPLLEHLRDTHPGLSPCQPADTLFHRHLAGEYDVLVALYHDQALAPLKTLEFNQSVNLTLGLPHLRTSPDHGTAYPLAGKHTANLASWNNAVHLARILTSPQPIPSAPEKIHD
jgi:4-hydroxythreonine-4-phosphate dehydrogenase